ncbi:MAG: hypothetical protein QM731_12650 [Chitinophagaceae bacterium]
MPRQTGIIKRERRVGILVFYKMRNKYFVRALSSLSSERVKNSKEFKNTMFYANRMVIASKLAGVIYRQLPPAWKLHALYRKLTGYAMQLLKEEMNATDILRKLPELLYQLGYNETIQYETIRPSVIKYREEKDKIRRKKTRNQGFCIRNDKDEICDQRLFIRKKLLVKCSPSIPIIRTDYTRTRAPDS